MVPRSLTTGRRLHPRQTVDRQRVSSRSLLRTTDRLPHRFRRRHRQRRASRGVDVRDHAPLSKVSRFGAKERASRSSWRASRSFALLWMPNTLRTAQYTRTLGYSRVVCVVELGGRPAAQDIMNRANGAWYSTVASIIMHMGHVCERRKKKRQECGLQRGRNLRTVQ